MRKTIVFIILAYCLTVTSAFSQITIDFQINEDKTMDTAPIYDYGLVFIKTIGDLGDNGQTTVRLEMENNSNVYSYLLFDRDWPKKELRKNHIFLEIGDKSKKVQNIKLLKKDAIEEIRTNGRYTFPDIQVEEGKTYEYMIPIHLAKPKPNWFCKKKKKLYQIIDCTIHIQVESSRDEVYEKLKFECDSLKLAFHEALEREEFCTHPLHRPSFERQTEQYTEANHELRDLIRRPLYENGWPKESKKYARYQDLMTSLDEMDDALEQYKDEKHYCGKDEKKIHSCAYCKLSLQEIYKILNRHYMDLHNGTVQKSDVMMKEVNALYKCSQQRKNSDPYKAGIIEFYEKIKNY